jgi:hypothetical protein
MFCHVFTAIATIVPSQYMSYILLEFIDSQSDLGQEIKSFIYDLLVHVLFEGRSFVMLEQLIRQNMIPPSKSLANLLIGEASPKLMQQGLDMLKKLDCNDDVLSILTNTGRVFFFMLTSYRYWMQFYLLKLEDYWKNHHQPHFLMLL